MKIITALLFCTVFCSTTVSAQAIRYSTSLPYIRMGAYAKQPADPFCFTGNQASLAQIRQAGIGIYGERRFMISAISAYNMVAVLPTKLGNLGLQLNYDGFKNFNESSIGLAYARKLGARADIGIQFNYYGYRIPSYNKAGTINFEAGIMLHLTNQLNFGIHIYNPVGGKLGKGSAEKLASVYTTGLGYNASTHFFVSAEVIKEEDKPVNVTAGVQYWFSHHLFLRAGFMSESSAPYAGAGIGWRNMRLDIAVSHHPQLGFSPGILLIMSLKPVAQ